jgi:hypothetical protein
MNLKVSVKYQLDENKRPVIIFYIIAFLLWAVSLIAIMPANGSDTIKGRLGGIELATIIFLFIAGMNSFRDTFRMFMQNSISRKTLFTGRLICVIVISGIMALIDTIINITGRIVIASVSKTFINQSFFEIIYGMRYNSQFPNFLFTVESILFAVASYSAASMFGYFITVLYYRLNKGGKIIVSVGVPVLLFITLPFVDSFILNSAIEKGLKRFSLFAFGLSNGAKPWMGIMTLVLTFLFFSGLSWLMIKKAAVKD